MRSLLLILICFTAFTVNLTGLLMITDPAGELLNLPHSLLTGTPFKNFLVPGLILTIFVGSTNFLAVYYIIQKHLKQYNFALAGGLSLIICVLVMALLVPSIHGFHLLYLTIGIFICLIASQLKGKWVV